MSKKKISFRTKVISLTLFSCLASVSLLWIVQMILSMHYFSVQTRVDLNFYLKSTSEQFNAKIGNVENMIIAFRNNSVIKEFMKGNKYNLDKVREQFQNNADLFSEVNIINRTVPFVDCVYLFNKNRLWISSHFYPQIIEVLEQRNHFVERLAIRFFETNDEYLYVSTENETYLCTNLYDDEMYKNGCCVISLKKQAVEDLLRNSSQNYRDIIYLVTGSSGQVLFSSFESKILEDKINGTIESGFHQKFQDPKYIRHTKQLGFGIYITLFVNKNLINARILSMISPFTVIFIAVVLVTGIVVFRVTIKLTQPLKWIGEDIKKFGTGKLDSRMRSFETEEFDTISQIFNRMTEQIHNLITEVYQKQIIATQAEVKYLQSQINPHFMFNILSMLQMRVALRGDMQVYQLLGAFSNLIQGKIFRKGEIEILLKEEIELIEFYLLLQSERFGGKITYTIDCPRDVEKARIPRLMIEPLIENAVAHGLEPKQGKGHVSVLAKRVDTHLIICVEDNGIGFSVTNLEKKVQKSTEKHTHIGLLNTKLMLQSVYGENASMEIKSIVNEGSCVIISVPFKQEEQCVDSSDC